MEGVDDLFALRFKVFRAFRSRGDLDDTLYPNSEHSEHSEHGGCR